MREQTPRLLAAWLGVPLLAVGCRGEPAASLAPQATAAAPAASAAAPPSADSARPAAASSMAAQPAPSSSAPAAASASASAASTPSSNASDDPALTGPDGAALPQTEQRPTLSSPSFQRRMRELADSILTGDVERGRKCFFPLVAYAQVKDVQKPERDYRYRLMAHFERDVREYHKELGKGAEQAEFLGVDVPEPRAQWMKPGKEGNRLGYFRVLRSRLRFRLAGGAEKTFELTSMISWRGEWYVVHLHGFE